MPKFSEIYAKCLSHHISNLRVCVLAATMTKSVNDVSSKLNECILEPGTISELSKTCVDAISDKLAEGDRCSGDCVKEISQKIDTMFSDRQAISQRDQQTWSAIAKHNSPMQGNDFNLNTAPQQPQKTSSQSCNPETTVVVNNVKSFGLIKHSSVIKQHFNQQFKQMKIKSCFSTSKGSLFIELTSETDANKVIRDWKGTYFSIDANSPTVATLLVDKGAQGIMKSVPLDLSNEDIDAHLQEKFPGSKARRFENRNGKLFTVLITFANRDQLLQAINDDVAVGYMYFDVTKFIPKKSLTRCYNCLRFDHVAKWCKHREKTCKHCAGDHLSDVCPDPSKLSCINCQGTHSSVDSTCPKYVQKIDAINKLNSNVQ